MITIDEKVERSNRIKETEFKNVSSLIYNSFLVTSYSRAKAIENKDILINEFIDFLSKYFESDLIKDDSEKTYLLNLIDKLTLQKEFIQLRRKEITQTNLQQAGRRLGKKSQSAFSKKLS